MNLPQDLAGRILRTIEMVGSNPRRKRPGPASGKQPGKAPFRAGVVVRINVGGGRTWWSHLQFTRINIDLTILPKSSGKTLKSAVVPGFIDVSAFLRQLIAPSFGSGGCTGGRAERADQRRRVDMSAQLAATLLAWRRQQRARCVEKGVPVPDWVFPSLGGTPLEERNMRHVFKRLLEKAELRQIRIQDLRHTYASLRSSRGSRSCM
jgi:hypothetical protein